MAQKQLPLRLTQVMVTFMITQYEYVHVVYIIETNSYFLK